jgi:hypothetical protein
MHSAAILAQENRELRAANEKQRKKKQRSSKHLTHTGSLTIEEGRQLAVSSTSQIEQIRTFGLSYLHNLVIGLALSGLSIELYLICQDRQYPNT